MIPKWESQLIDLKISLCLAEKFELFKVEVMCETYQAEILKKVCRITNFHLGK